MQKSIKTFRENPTNLDEHGEAESMLCVDRSTAKSVTDGQRKGQVFDTVCQCFEHIHTTHEIRRIVHLTHMDEDTLKIKVISVKIYIPYGATIQR